MLATYLHKPNEILLAELPTPEPLANEVRVRIQKTGICGSDVHLFLGHRLLEKPMIIGHEGLGYIDKIGEDVKGREVGERVVIEPNYPCKKCSYCASGRGNICVNKGVLGINKAGAFAEYICVPADFAWKVPHDISDANAVTIEPMAVAYHALFASKAQPGDAVAVIGLGAIGLLLAHLALKLGYKVFVTEINEKKLEKAVEQGGVPLSPRGKTLEEQTQFLEQNWLANDVVAVFECAGSAFTASLAAAAAPRGADIVLVGLSEKPATFTPLKIAREGITVVPSIIYDHPFDFKRVIQLIQAKIIEPSFIISGYEPLSNLQKALEKAAEGDESKIIIEVESTTDNVLQNS